MLTIKGLSKTYDNGVRALDDVSLEIPNGMFGLLGPNGAGKSSLMRTIATLQDADAGSIDFDGVDVLREKDRVRQLLGYLPQDFGVYPKVRAEDMLEHLATLKGLVDGKSRRETVKALLKQTNLWDFRARALGSYSGGMRQRFGIAQALIGNPRLVIVDEPTAGLDPEERNRFLNLLAEIGEQTVVILSTHIVEDVTDLCPRMAILSRGRVLLAGEPRRAIEALRGKIWRRQVEKHALADYQARFNVLSMRRLAGEPIINIHAEQQPEPGFESVPPDLEDVYFLKLREQQRALEASATTDPAPAPAQVAA